ncbi:unnamed protein product [Symbiodinium sp. CCMP2592]|nr:unnamed protein product [Symbiodinium sp. CCMP2592]
MAAPRTRTGSGGSSNDFNFRAAGSKTEAAIKEMEHGVHKFFTGMEESLSKITRPSWLGGGSGPSKQAPAPPVVHSKQEHPTPTPSGEDDSTMRHHCAALERLVEMGLSPQAAKVAVRHLDSWLVSEDGRSEMAVAEAEATSTGEAILHVHDQVRLEGLVKNKGTNGMMGTLEAYGAESHRWKVRLTDDQVFWIKPKLLRPLKMQRMPLPLPDPSPPEHTTGEDEQALGGLESLPLDPHGTLRVALPFCGSMQELPILAHFLSTRCSGRQGVAKISILASDVQDWAPLGGYWKQKETYVKRWYPHMDLKFCQLDLHALQHPPSSLTFAFHPECTVHRDLWRRILHNVISASAVCIVCTFNDEERKAGSAGQQGEGWEGELGLLLALQRMEQLCQVVLGVCQDLGRQAQCQRNPYYADSKRNGSSGTTPPFLNFLILVR